MMMVATDSFLQLEQQKYVNILYCVFKILSGTTVRGNVYIQYIELYKVSK